MSQSSVATIYLCIKVKSNLGGRLIHLQCVRAPISGDRKPKNMHVLTNGNTLEGNKMLRFSMSAFILCFVSFPSTLLMVMLITWVVRRRLTEEGGFFWVESRTSSAKDVRLLSMWRFVLLLGSAPWREIR